MQHNHRPSSFYRQGRRSGQNSIWHCRDSPRIAWSMRYHHLPNTGAAPRVCRNCDWRASVEEDSAPTVHYQRLCIHSVHGAYGISPARGLEQSLRWASVCWTSFCRRTVNVNGINWPDARSPLSIVSHPKILYGNCVLEDHKGLIRISHPWFSYPFNLILATWIIRFSFEAWILYPCDPKHSNINCLPFSPRLYYCTSNSRC